MSSMQIVFLFDLNAYGDGLVKSIEELQEKLVCLRLTCLRILTHYSSTVSNLKWGFKFFDSRGTPTQTMCKFSYPNVSLENFETLENEICFRFQRHFLYLEALTLSAERSEPSRVINDKTEAQQTPIQLLQLALTQILCEYQWNDSIDMFSPSTRKSVHKNKRNQLFLISKCACNVEEFQNYFGSDYLTCSVPKLSKILLSQSLQQQLLRKEAIQWIWLNTGEESFMQSSEPDVLSTIADSLRFLQCALVPLSVLSFPNCVLKLNQKLKEQDLEVPVFSISCGSLAPFPSSVNQSISYPFYKNEKETPKEIELCFLENTLRIPVIVTRVPVQWKKKDQKALYDRMLNQTNCTDSSNREKDELNVPNSWTKLTAYFAVAKDIQLKPNHILLCMPDVSNKSSSHHKFQVLIKSMFIRNINLFIVCESSCGSVVPGIFTPLSDSSAVISVLEPSVGFTNMKLFNTSKSNCTFDISDVKERMRILEEDTENFELNISNSNKDFELVNGRPNIPLKPYTMASMERWFVPPSSFPNTLSTIEDETICNPEVAAFHNLLQQSNSLRKKPKKKNIKEEQTPIPEPKESPEQSSDQEDTDDICKDLSYDQLVAISTDTYAKALKSSGSVLHCGKKIVKMASSFFLKQSIIKYEENMKNFMTEYFLVNCRKLIEKYGSDQDKETGDEAINECKLQAILALEMELLFPSFEEESSCVNSVSSILGIMSFFTGATVLVKYLQNDLLESYGRKLYDLLVEIGDELCIPLKSDDDSPGDPFEASSPVSLTEIASSVSSATLSLLSSQSASNKSDGRKLLRKRSDISVTSKRRQILLPAKSPRKKKSKNTFSNDNIPIRYSPRLASKKRKDRFKSVEAESKGVRRNLFAQDRKIHTPRSSLVLTRSPFKKKKVTTPKRHHVLKTDFVPDTPTPKQNLSRLQRRKSQLGFHSDNSEVLGSTPSKSPKGRFPKTDFVPGTPSCKQNLSALQRRKSHAGVTNEIREIAESPTISGSANVSETKNYPSCSSSQYTPDSKRRLSLKLFSKALASPTARMGLKKCSKRLFDQVESQPPSGPRKRMKF